MNGIRTHRPATARGFTLIELLIVIGIIAALAGLATVAYVVVFAESKITATRNTLTFVESALATFESEYPTRRYGGGSVSGPLRSDGDGKVELDRASDGQYWDSGMTEGEFLRIMLCPTQDEIDNLLKDIGITKPILEINEAEAHLNRRDLDWEGREIPKGTCFVDAWGQPLRYRCPGRDHSKEENADGQNGIDTRQTGDLWSLGADGEDSYPDGTSYEQWNDTPNDPDNQDAGNDDICNWFKERG